MNQGCLRIWARANAERSCFEKGQTGLTSAECWYWDCLQQLDEGLFHQSWQMSLHVLVFSVNIPKLEHLESISCSTVINCFIFHTANFLGSCRGIKSCRPIMLQEEVGDKLTALQISFYCPYDGYVKMMYQITSSWPTKWCTPWYLGIPHHYDLGFRVKNQDIKKTGQTFNSI